MRRLPELGGVIVPVLTPFTADDRLDSAGVEKYASIMLASDNVDGLFVAGACGEFNTMSEAERIELIELYSGIEKNGKPVVVNTGGMENSRTLKLSRRAAAMGFSAIAVTVPDGIEPRTEAVIEYFRPIADLGAPFFVYWTPMVPKHKPTPDIIRRMTEFRNFVGFKDSSRDMVEFSSMAAEFREEIGIIQGVEMLHLASLAAGSSGVIGGGLNLYPGWLKQISRYFEAGDLAAARKMQLRVNETWRRLSQRGSIRTICKQYWHRRGVIGASRCRIGDETTPNTEEWALLDRIVNL